MFHGGPDLGDAPGDGLAGDLTESIDGEDVLGGDVREGFNGMMGQEFAAVAFAQIGNAALEPD